MKILRDTFFILLIVNSVVTVMAMHNDDPLHSSMPDLEELSRDLEELSSSDKFPDRDPDRDRDHYERDRDRDWYDRDINDRLDDHKPRKRQNLFDTETLVQMAPIALAVYCYHEFPRITMMTLSVLVIYILSQSDNFRSKARALKKKIKGLLVKLHRVLGEPVKPLIIQKQYRAAAQAYILCIR